MNQLLGVTSAVFTSCLVDFFRLLGFRIPLLEDLIRRPPLHAAPAVGTAAVVGLDVASRASCISLTDSYQVVRPFTLRCSSRSVWWKRFAEPVRLRPARLRPPVLDLLELEEQLVGVPVLSVAELAPVVAEDRPDLHAVLLEEREYVVVQHL